MTKPAAVSCVVVVAMLSLAGFVRPATGQAPERAATPRLVVPAGVTAPLPGQPTTAPTTAAPAEPAPAAPAPVSAAPAPSGVTQVLPAAAPPATASSSQTALAAERSYVAGKFGLTLDGVPIGWAKSVEGGDASADVVVEKAGPDHISGKHLSNIKYEPIAVVTDLPSRTLSDWIAGSWKGTAVRKNGSIQSMSYDLKILNELEFMNALVAETTMPALDAASKENAQITIKILPEYTRTKPGSGQSGSGIDAKSQKRWTRANFRFEMSGLDGTKVNKIDSITVRQTTVENPVGELRDYEKEPGKIEFSNLKITLAALSAQTWVDWHNDFLVKGNSGAAQERSGAIVYLDPTRTSELGRVNLSNCGIFRLGREKAEAGSESIQRMVAELYCERMELVVNNAGK
ncbi:MAG TPA: phage tail protein [Gemmatimonadales bacterium]|nr:phage tail protein [Gemmatimonadales bacterium]